MHIEVKSSPIDGKGVFATQPIPAAQIIHTLGGKRLSMLACGILTARGKIRMEDPLQIGKWHYIALDALSVCFNHSCQPNAGVRADSELFALADIKEGDEITFDYSLTVRPSVFTHFWRMACLCRSQRCRHLIGPFNTIPRDQLDEYVKIGAIQDYMLDLVPQRRLFP